MWPDFSIYIFLFPFSPLQLFTFSQGASLEDLLSRLKIKGGGDGGSSSDAAGQSGGEGGEEGAGKVSEIIIVPLVVGSVMYFL